MKWHTHILQFLKEVNKTVLQRSGSSDNVVSFQTKVSGDFSIYSQHGVQVLAIYVMTGECNYVKS